MQGSKPYTRIFRVSPLITDDRSQEAKKKRIPLNHLVSSMSSFACGSDLRLGFMVLGLRV